MRSVRRAANEPPSRGFGPAATIAATSSPAAKLGAAVADEVIAHAKDDGARTLTTTVTQWRHLGTQFGASAIPDSAMTAGLVHDYWDAIGYVAAALVVVTFYQRRMIPLRLAALGSNLAFIAYGVALGLAPVWLLHAVLLPVNARRLAEALSLKNASDPSAQAHRAVGQRDALPD